MATTATLTTTIAAAGAGESALAAVAAAVRDLAAPPVLVLVFPDAEEDLAAVAPALHAATGGAELAGMASRGVFGTTPGANTATALAIGGQGVSAAVRIGVGADAAPREAAATAAREAIAATAGPADQAAQPGCLLLLFYDAGVPDHADVVAGAYAAAGPSWPLAGGAAATPAGRPGVIADGAALEHAVVAVAVRTSAPIGVGVAYGWRPCGVPALVTRASGSVVEQLNGRRADEVYLELLGRADQPLPDDEAFSDLSASHPLAQPELTGEVRLRHVFGRTPTGGLQCATPIPANAAVVVAEQDREHVIASVPDAVAAALEPLTQPPRAALVFDCASRRHTLGDALEREQAALAAAIGPAVPTAGTFTHGEVGRSRGAIGDRAHAVVVVTLG